MALGVAPLNPKIDPGPGIVGQGGRNDGFNKARRPHGAGVIAIAVGVTQRFRR